MVIIMRHYPLAVELICEVVHPSHKVVQVPLVIGYKWRSIPNRKKSHNIEVYILIIQNPK